MGTTHAAHTNRLAREKSPYLLQHQHNPVDWFPWGAEAFEKARQESKPIFLSIGYSTCHWCHVMERESFEHEEIARYLNAHFVSIKVDREERPDVDKIYMTAVQAIGQGGGWPLNAFLTPDLKPFYGGTYFPPEPRHGRPSFLQVLQSIHEMWEKRRSELEESSRQLHAHLENLSQQSPDSQALLGPALIRNAAARFKEEFDSRHGGFGSAPKFPRPSQPIFLLRYSAAAHDPDAAQMVFQTCRKMAAGGIHDQLGGGFARYSVDAEWLVPHFEKMLYDNAQLLNLYLDAFLASNDSHFADVARDILRYVLRDMTHPQGGFYSAEDADSEGKEGKFYCWTQSELAQVLSPEELNIATRYFGITEEGNFSDHSDPNPLPNQNVLSIVHPDLSAADQLLLQAAKQKMFQARSSRVRPHLDDKILTSWNGMMLGALSRASLILGDAAYLAAAEKNLAFLRAHLWDPATGSLYTRWRDGERDSILLLESYANLLHGVVDLYEATLNPGTLDFAIALAEGMLGRFYDDELGGFWQSAGTPSDLILKLKEDYDGAEPSGNSVAVLALLRLSAITDRSDFHHAAERTLRLFAERLQRLPQALPHMIIALDYWLHEPKRVVIAGDTNLPSTRALLQAAHSVFQPYKIVLGTLGAVEPFASTLSQHNNQPTAYLCFQNACQPPAQHPEKIRELLQM